MISHIIYIERNLRREPMKNIQKGIFSNIKKYTIKLFRYLNKKNKKEALSFQNESLDTQKIVSIIKIELKNEIDQRINKWLTANIITFIGIIISMYVFYDNKFVSINQNYENINAGIISLTYSANQIYNETFDMQDKISTMEKYLYNDGGVQTQLREINTKLNIEPINIPNTEEFSDIQEITKINDKRYTQNDKTYSIHSDTIIGINLNGEQCLSSEYIDKTILLVYKEGNKEIYFLGQYNNKYQWDGYCITNVYDSNDSLISICESNFENGKRKDYKSFYPSYSNVNQWIYTDRICNNDENIGITKYYESEYNKAKNFTNTNVRVTDILRVDSFIEKIAPKILSYYSGKTSNEKYNDDSGNAYLVIYDSDGKVKTLYVGKFSNGTFNDNDDNDGIISWDISYSFEYGFYVHNTGKFKNGRAVNPSSEPINSDDIKRIAPNENFDCELIWK